LSSETAGLFIDSRTEPSQERPARAHEGELPEHAREHQHKFSHWESQNYFNINCKILYRCSVVNSAGKTVI